MPNTSSVTTVNSPNMQSVLQEGAAKAFQSVAQSTALAVQDAVDNLRNVNTISTTASGVAMSQMLAHPDPAHIAIYKEIINNAQGMSTAATQNFQQIGASAAVILNAFQLKSTV